MTSLRPFNHNKACFYCRRQPLHSHHASPRPISIFPTATNNFHQRRRSESYSRVRSTATDGEQEGQGGGGRRSFLSMEEAGLVEISGLGTHERFLCRLTISSLNLLRVIAEQEGCEMEELNAGRVCDWFLKDKLKREQDIGSAVLQWDESDDFTI